MFDEYSWEYVEFCGALKRLTEISFYEWFVEISSPKFYEDRKTIQTLSFPHEKSENHRMKFYPIPFITLSYKFGEIFVPFFTEISKGIEIHLKKLSKCVFIHSFEISNLTNEGFDSIYLQGFLLRFLSKSCLSEFSKRSPRCYCKTNDYIFIITFELQRQTKLW